MKTKFKVNYTIILLFIALAGINSCRTIPVAFKVDYAFEYSTSAHTPQRPVLYAIKKSQNKVLLSVCVFTEGMAPDSTHPGYPVWQFRADFENWNPSGKTIVHSQTFSETYPINSPFIPDTVWLNFTGEIETTPGDYIILHLTDRITGLNLFSWAKVVDSIFPLVKDEHNNYLAYQWIKENENLILPSNIAPVICKSCYSPLPRPPFEMQPISVRPALYDWEPARVSPIDEMRSNISQTGLLKFTHKECDTSYFIPLTSTRYPFPVINQDGLLAIRYLTTREEFTSLLAHKDLSESLHLIWQNGASDMERAMVRARQFVEKINSANTFFTFTKPGSLTDRGLIWIVIGQPNRVWKSPMRETWFYDSLDDGLPLRLDFNLTSGAEGIPDWVLHRSPGFKSIWNRAVDRWRR